MKLRLLCYLLTAVLLAACTLSTQKTNRYQSEVNESQAGVGPVAELHRKAIAALAMDNSEQAIEYLQRAIKIEPRNAFSWHYLAQSYWHHRDYAKCLAMIDRAYSYSTVEDDLERANAALKQQCLTG